MEKYTDQEFFYKQTPVNYDGIAKFTSIKGNTLVWNQLLSVPTSATQTISGITFTNNNDGSITANGTATANAILYMPGHAIISGHKYLLKGKNTSIGGANIMISLRANNGSTVLASDQGSGNLFTASASYDSQVVTLFRIQNGTTVSNLTVYPQLFDLTQMGLDISSPSEFTSLFPLSYYDYNVGELISFKGNAIKTVGKNLLNYLNNRTTNDITFTYDQSSGAYKVEGTLSAPDAWSDVGINGTVVLNYPKLMKGTYKVSGFNPRILGRLQAWYDDGSNEILIETIRGESTFTLEKNAYMFLRGHVSGTGTSYDETVYPMISFADADQTFEPYKETTTDLPISTYFPTGMKRAGNVYDELTENKAITRVGEVDVPISSPNWQIHGSDRFYLNNWVPENIASNRNANITNNKGLAMRDLMGEYGSYMWFGSIGLYINRISSTETIAEMQTRLSGLKLYYELATETETDAEDIFYKFYADGTEQLLPVNGSSPTTSYLIADIEYYDSTEGDSLYRRFWLINGDGERWDLTDKEIKSFLNNPTGFGFRKTIEVTRYGEKANKNNEVYDFPQPSGELLFYDTYNSTRYDKYNKFIRFLMSQPITLYYMIPVSYISGIANIFTLDCDVTELQKTESKTDHILTSSIVFNGLGFYEGDEISINGTTNTYTLTNEGDFPVGFEITIEGSNMETPYITLSQDGELYGEAKFEGSEGTGYGGITFTHVYLNSNDGEQNLELKDQSSALLPNPLNYQDLSISNGAIYVTFIKLAKGVSELSIGMESGSLSSVNIKYSPKYRSV